MRIQKNLAQIRVDKDKCDLCGKCIGICPKDIFNFTDKKITIGNSDICIGCLTCAKSCPNGAIDVDNKRIKKFFISRTCNNSCMMCFEDDKDPNKEYTTKELLSQFDKEIKGDEEMIVLSGAEITTRKDLFLLLKHIREKNRKARIFLPTNGRMFSYNNYTNDFVKSNLGDVKITISVLGHNEQIHDKITNVKGSFRQTVKGIKNLLHFRQNININVTILKQNYKGIPKICDYFLPLGINSIQLALVEPNGKAKTNFRDFIPKMSECMPYILHSLNRWGGKVRVKNIPDCLLNGLHHLKNDSTQNHLKEKAGQCTQCHYQSDCPGIWNDYIKIYGSEELKPILREKTNKQSNLISKEEKTYLSSDFFSGELTHISFYQGLKEETLSTLYEILHNSFDLEPIFLYHSSSVYIDSNTLRNIYLFPHEKIISISKEIRDTITYLKNKPGLKEEDILPYFIVLCDIINYKYISEKFNLINPDYFLRAFSNLDIGLGDFYTKLLTEKSPFPKQPKEKTEHIIEKLRKIMQKSRENYSSFLDSINKKESRDLFSCLNENEKVHQQTGLYLSFLNGSDKPKQTGNKEKNILLKKGAVFYV